MREEFTVFIPGNVPSSKNSRMPHPKIKGCIIPSSQTSAYYRNTEDHWNLNSMAFRYNWDKFAVRKPWPIYIGFVRADKRRYDWINPVQCVMDRMVKFNWIDDDDVSNVIPFPARIDGSFHEVNAYTAGVYIKILSSPLMPLNIKTQDTLL